MSGAIGWITGVYLSVGLSLWFVWLVTQDERWIRSFFDYAGALFFVGMAGNSLLPKIFPTRAHAECLAVDFY